MPLLRRHRKVAVSVCWGAGMESISSRKIMLVYKLAQALQSLLEPFGYSFAEHRDLIIIINSAKIDQICKS